MAAFFHRITLRFIFVFLLAACADQTFGQETQTPDAATPAASAVQPQKDVTTPAQPATVPIHIIPYGTQAAPLKKQATPGGRSSNNGTVQYWGGPVISNVHVVEVLWGSFVAAGEMTDGTVNLDQFYTDVTQSNYFSLLAEYGTIGLNGLGTGTPGSNQTIGPGFFDTRVTITPTMCPGAANNPPCTITDTQIQSEIINQLKNLPTPLQDNQGNFNTLYMIYFPPGVSIQLDPTTLSCRHGGFCAYHSNVVPGSMKVPYGVYPDFSQGGCGPFQGCGNGSAFQNLTSASSHELAEAVTDTDVGTATAFAPPLAWADQVSGQEIGDFCNQNEAQITVNSHTYTVQSQWSNMQSACVSAPAHFQVQSPTVAVPGSQFSMTVAAQSSINNSQLPAYSDTVHFTSTDPGATLPADYTFVPADNGSHTFNVTLKATGSQTVTVTDTLVGAITASVALSVNDNPDLTVASFHSGNFTQGQNGVTYTLTASNVGDQPTVGTVTVSDNLPSGLSATNMTGMGWTCNVVILTCTRADALAAGAAYPPITLTVNVATTAPPAVTNVVSVSGGGEVNTFNDSFSDPTTINQLVAFTLSKSHAGVFLQGQIGATYTLTVSNIGVAASSGTVSVTDQLPGPLTATAMNGVGWNCTLGTLTCTRGDALAANSQYPPITLTVNVAATAPSTVTNTASVSGGGQTNTSNDTATDPTSIVPPISLSVTSSTIQSVPAGTSAAYSFTMNSGTSGTVNFACSNVPQAASCIFSPASAGQGTTSIGLTITTTLGGSAAPPVDGSGPRPLMPLVWLLAAIAAAEMLRRQLKIRSAAWRPVTGLAGIVVLALLFGCGGGPPPPPPRVGTPAGTYTITVTGTNASTNTQGSAQVTLIVH